MCEDSLDFLMSQKTFICMLLIFRERAEDDAIKFLWQLIRNQVFCPSYEEIRQ